VQKPQYEVCCEVLHRLREQKVLKEVYLQFAVSWRKTVQNVLRKAGQDLLFDRLATLTQ